MENITKGAANEYRVTVDLLERGFEVYRNASPRGLTDLIATKQLNDDEMLVIRVQAKSKHGYLDEDEKAQNDVMASVDNHGKVSYKTTPGLMDHFQDALYGDGLIDEDDKFAVTAHGKRNSEGFGTLRIKMRSVGKSYFVILTRRKGEPIRQFEFKLPQGVIENEFSNRMDKITRDMFDRAKTPDDLIKDFKSYPVLLGCNAVNII